MSVTAVSALALAAGLASTSSTATAVENNDAAASVHYAAAQVIVVTGSRNGYGADTTQAGTRTDTPIENVPQAITVVSERQIDDQAMRSIADVLRYVPGTMIGQGEGHRDQVTIRGNNSTADFFIDGLRDDIQYYRPLYNLQRVEVLRGPNAMIFGRGGGGGVINRVAKVPVFDRLVGASLSADTFGAWYADADLNLPLGPGAAVRLNGVYEEFANHRDAYEGRMFAINPTARVLAGPATGFTLSYEYVDDERLVDRGVPSRAGRPVTGFRDAFFGDAAINRLDFTGHILRGNFEHRFSDDLTLVSRLQYADYDKAYRNLFPATAVTADAAGQDQIGVEAYLDAFQRENLISQTDLVWRGATGPLAHTLLVGVEYSRQDTANQRDNGLFANPAGAGANVLRRNARLTDPFVPPAVVEWRAARSNLTQADVLAFYVQDQIDVGIVQIVAGLRHDRFRLDALNLLNGQTFRRTDNLWSPRLGLVVKPMEALSLYASFSRSYLPQSGDQFNSLDLTAAALEPERFDNYEIGAKWRARPGLILSAAAYRLDRTNTRAPGATAGTVVLTGEQRSRGIELEAVGQLRPNWQLTAAFALQEAEITATTASAPAGRAVPQVPRRHAALWTRYDATDWLGFGVGIHHQSRSFASISNAVVLPAFTRVDAGLFFRVTEAVEAQLNFENLLGETYYPTAHNDNNITTGAPRSARATVRLRF
jgi:catecholate siderophore receptor